MGIISPPPRAFPNPKTLLILGSSTGSGYGASTWLQDPSASNGYASPSTSWAGLLIAALKAKDPAWTSINRSISGSHTRASLQRFKDDVTPHRPSHVILCTSVQNEPLYGIDNAKAVQTWLCNTRELIGACQSIGAQPIIASTYPRNSNNGISYQASLDANAQIEGFGVPILDWMSTMDDGTGKFVGGTTFSLDGTHATDTGQIHYFDAIDLSLFTQAFIAGQTETGSGAWKLTGTGLAFPVVLSSATRSWTMRAKLKSASGVSTGSILMAANTYAAASTYLRLRAPSNVAVLSDSSGDLATSTYDITTDFTVHDVVIRYNAATGKAALFIDGTQVGADATPAGTIQAVTSLGFLSRPDQPGSSALGMSLSDVCVWRAPLGATKIAALASTLRVPTASLSFRGRLANAPRQIVPNSAPTDALPLIGGASWAQVAAF